MPTIDFRIADTFTDSLARLSAEQLKGGPRPALDPPDLDPKMKSSDQRALARNSRGKAHASPASHVAERRGRVPESPR